MNTDTKKRAVFLDRDGTINEECEYLHRPEEFSFIPGVQEAILKFKKAGFLVVVVTNQSGVARGYYDEDAVHRLHSHMDQELAAFGCSVDAYYFCPHYPGAESPVYGIECNCRKPNPGMLEQAAIELNIDLSESWMIGDKLIDVEAGQRAGCKAALVLTGYGEEYVNKLPPGVPAFADLLEAARAVVSSQ